MSESKRKAEQAHAASAVTGRVPVSTDTLLRLSRLWFTFQGAQDTATQAQAAVQTALGAYVEGLTAILEAREIDVPVVLQLPDGSSRTQIEVDWKARELVLPRMAAPSANGKTPTTPELEKAAV